MRFAPHERLRDLRERNGFRTQKQFCAHARRQGYDLNLRRYGGIERGDITPSLDDIVMICEAMRISADSWLFGREPLDEFAELNERERAVVKQWVRGLLSLRDR